MYATSSTVQGQMCARIDHDELISINESNDIDPNSNTDILGLSNNAANVSSFVPRRMLGPSPFKHTQNNNSHDSLMSVSKDLFSSELNATPSESQSTAFGEEVLVSPELPIHSFSSDFQPISYESQFEDLPEAVNDMFVGCKQEKNTGGGGCLYKSAAAHVTQHGMTQSSVSYSSLRKYCHSKIIQWWPHFSCYYSWPFEFTVGTGANMMSKVVNSDKEYFEFLNTMASVDSYTESEVDLLVLSYVLGINIEVVTHNLPEEQVPSRVSCVTYYGEGVLNEQSD